MKDMVLTAFELNYFVTCFEIVETNGTFGGLFEENVTKREVLDVSHYFTVHLPALRYY